MSNMTIDDFSVLHVIGEEESTCGYCKKNKCKEYYLYAERISCEDAEKLLLCGWRRCSNLYYQASCKPECCIKRMLLLATKEYEPTSSQKRVVRRFERYLRGETSIVNGKLVPVNPVKKQSNPKPYENHVGSITLCQQLIINALQSLHLSFDKPILCKEKVHKQHVIIYSPLLCQMKLDESAIHELQAHLQNSISSINNIQKVEIENSFINFYTSLPLPSKQPKPPKVVIKPRELKLFLVNATEDEEVFNLYALYQKEIFHENPTMESFMDFLGDGFLTQDDDHKLGTYWLKWYIDGELVAVSVLDMYPSILSSVYFFYNPAYRCLSIGIYGAIKEIEFAISNQKQFYSLGLYIEECPRMRYKGSFRNSFVLCHTTRKFYRLDDVRKPIEAHSMCLEEDAALLKKEMEEVQTQIEDVKRNMIIICPLGTKFGLFSFADYAESPMWNEIMKELLPMLPSTPMLYFVKGCHVC